jgi:hypothetical protein
MAVITDTTFEDHVYEELVAVRPATTQPPAEARAELVRLLAQAYAATPLFA